MAVINSNAGSWSVSGTTAYYKIGGKTVATLKGLQSGLSVDDFKSAVEAGDGSAAGTISISSDMVDSKGVTLTLSNSGKYVLDLAEGFKGATTITNAQLVPNGTKATVTGTLTKGYRVAADGKSLIYLSEDKNGQTLATVTGLKNNFSTSAVSLAEEGNSIVLTKDALAKTKVALSSSYGYTLTFDDGTAKDDGTSTLGFDNATGTNKYWSVSGTTAYYRHDVGAGWTLNSAGNAVTYTAATKPVDATVKGLVKGLTTKTVNDEGETVAAYIDGIDVGEAESGNIPIKLSKNVLTTTKVSIAGTGYELALNAFGEEDTIPDGTDLTRVVPTDGEGDDNYTNVWTFSKGTATYKAVNRAYWTLNDNGTITCTPQKNVSTLATIKGLNTGLKVQEVVIGENDDAQVVSALGYDKTTTADGVTTTEFIPVIEVDETSSGNFILSKGALTTGGVTLVNGKDPTKTTSTYSLRLNVASTDSDSDDNSGDDETLSGNGDATETETVDDSLVPAPTPSNFRWVVNNTTAALKANVTEGWSVTSDTTIAYNKALTGNNLATLATISGLRKGFVAHNGTYTYEAPKAVEGEESAGTVKYGLEDYGITVTATPETVSSDNVGTNLTDYSFMLGINPLGTAKVTTAKGTGTTSALAIGSGVTTNKEDGSAPDTEYVWSLAYNKSTKTTTATYKTIVPKYYTLNSDKNAISYTAEKVDNVNAVITGLLASGLKVGTEEVGEGDDKETISVVGTYVTTPSEEEGGEATTRFVPGLKITKSPADEEKGTIQLSENVLTNKNVALTTGKTNYALELKNAASLAPAEESKGTWTVSKGTAILRGTTKQGWVANVNGDAITYSAQKTGDTFAKITGLNTALTSDDLKGENSPVVISTANADGIKTLTLSKGALTAGDVTLTQGTTGYELALSNATGDDAAIPTSSIEEKDIWAFVAKAGDTPAAYVYKKVKPAYYGYAKKADSEDDDKTKISYTAQADVDGGEKFRITGLAAGLLSDEGKMTGVSTPSSDDDKEITISADALDKNAVALTGEGYTLALDDEGDDKVATPTAGDKYFAIDGDKVKYNYDTSAGYTLGGESKAITYSKNEVTTTLATIEGLKTSAFTITDGKAISDDISLGTGDDAKQFTLSKGVLDGKNVTIKSEGYTLAVAADLGVTNDQTTWKLDDDKNWAYKKGSTEGYAVKANSEGKEIEYTDANYGTTLATIKGLKENLVVDGGKLGTNTGDDGAFVEGVTFGTEKGSENQITLSKDVLSYAKDIEIEHAEGQEYSITLGEGTAPVDKEGWTNYTYDKKKGFGTATFTETTTAGYTAGTGDDEGKFIYSAQVDTPTTISGLINGIEISDNGQSIGIKTEVTADAEDGDATGAGDLNEGGEDGTKETTPTYEYKGVTMGEADEETGIRTITLSENVLNKKNIALAGAGSDNYKLDLEAPADEGDPYWTVTAVAAKKATKTVAAVPATTTANYLQKIAPGYTLAVDGKSIAYSTKDTIKTLAKITGLKSGVTVADGQIEGISVADNDISLTTAVLGTNATIVLDTKGDYELALADTLLKAQIAEPYWTFTKGSATGTAKLIAGKTAFWNYEPIETVASSSDGEETGDEESGGDDDGGAEDVETPNVNKKKLIYNAADLQTLATVTGLKNTLKVNEDGSIDGLAFNVDYTPVTEAEDDGAQANPDDGEPADVDDPADEAETLTSSTITVSADALVGKTVAVADGEDKRYTFALELDGDVAEVEYGDNVWYSDGKGNVNYQRDKSAGYTLADDSKSITYSNAGTEIFAKLEGLSTALTKGTYEEITGIEVTAPTEAEGATSAANGKFTLNDTAYLAGKNITLTKGDGTLNYELAVDESIKPQNFEEPQLYIKSSTKTATNVALKDGTTSGYQLKDANTVEFKTEASSDIATISNLKKGLTLEDITAGIYVDFADGNKGGSVSLTEDVLGGATITIANKTYKDGSDTKNYAFKFDEDSVADFVPEAQDPFWASFSKGTAVLKQTTTAGYTLTGEDTLTYSAAKTPAVATVAGLATTLKLVSGQLGTYQNIEGVNTFVPAVTVDVGEVDADTDNIITLNQEALGTGTTKFTANSGKYQFALDEDVVTNEDTDDWQEITEWVTSGTTATYQTHNKAYHTLNGDNNQITYQKATTGTALAKLSGFKSGININDLNSEGTITFGAGQLAGKNVTLQNLDTSDNAVTFKLALDTDTANSDNAVTETKLKVDSAWSNTTTKGVATLKGTLNQGYRTANDDTIIYQSKDASKTLATVSGLKGSININNVFTSTNNSDKSATDNDDYTILGQTIGVDDEISGTLSLGKAQLNAKAASISGTGFSIALDTSESTGVTATELTVNDSWVAANKNGVAILQGVYKAGYTQASDQSITYLASNATKTVASVSGLKTGAQITDDNGVITLSKDQLNAKNVAVTTSLGDNDYTLALSTDKDGDNNPLISAPTAAGTSWNYKSGAASLMGAVSSAGYELAQSAKAVTYTAATAANKPIATIKGVKAAPALDEVSDQTIYLATSNLNKSVTVSGGAFSFSFDENYIDALIVGSAAADSIAVAGSGISINAGNGDDYVDLGSAGGNTFYYATGNGNDVIANFSATDAIKITKGTPEVKKDTDDVVIKVGTGSIKLKNYSGESVTINGTAYALTAEETADDNPLLRDDNFTTMTPQLSEIVKASAGNTALGDLDLNNATSLTQKNTVIAYSGKK